MAELNDQLPQLKDAKHPHYWVREDFDYLMGLIPDLGFPIPHDRDSGTSIRYTKSTEGAVRELKLRGLQADGFLVTKLTEKGILNPERGHSLAVDEKDELTTVPSTRILSWDKEQIDAAAEWLYQHDYWGSWTHFCWVANLRFGQAVKAHRVACARYGLAFQTGFDIPGFLTVIEPAQDATRNYATVSFYPDTMKAEVTKK